MLAAATRALAPPFPLKLPLCKREVKFSSHPLTEEESTIYLNIGDHGSSLSRGKGTGRE
jgi:hypothetical protein